MLQMKQPCAHLGNSLWHRHSAPAEFVLHSDGWALKILRIIFVNTQGIYTRPVHTEERKLLFIRHFSRSVVG